MIFFTLLPAFQAIWGQNAANYSEEKIPTYTLPKFFNTEKNNREAWDLRREEILHLFEDQVYGKTPKGEWVQQVEVKESDPSALDGKALRKQVRLLISGQGKKVSFDLLLYLPSNIESPVPVFLGLNFNGNHTVHSDPHIILPSSWVKNNEKWGITDNQTTTAARGAAKSRWPVEMILERGYGLAVMYCGDSDPDFDDGFQNGVHPLFLREGKAKPDTNEWGSIGAWAWSLSRAMDYLVQDEDVDPLKVAVIGHSRLGKTALWAGVQDTRFAMVISNDSGCGGAALFRRKFGETAHAINSRFPHWFCDNFTQYNHREEELPVDQHMLLALVAPRLLYVASATQDAWADPKGEFLATKKASELYQEIFQTEGLNEEMPAPNQSIQRGKVAYHIREGKHDITAFDWEQYLKFADAHWK